MNLAGADGLFLHASAVVAGGGALLFLGHSTSGKSTISQLLKQNYSSLADDTMFATCDSCGCWRVVDGKFRFMDFSILNWQVTVRQRFAEGLSTPLLGCLRIHKARHVKVARLAPVETARYLMDAVMEVDVQRKFGRMENKADNEKPDIACIRQMRLHWFHQAAVIARAYPGWHLWFSRDSHLPDLYSAVAAVAEEARRQRA